MNLFPLLAGDTPPGFSGGRGDGIQRMPTPLRTRNELCDCKRKYIIPNSKPQLYNGLCRLIFQNRRFGVEI